MNRINDGKLIAEQAGEFLGLSERHARRMLARYRLKGAEALAHGNRGKESERRIPEGQRSRIVSLARGPYAGVNQQHLAELLADREQIAVFRSTLRRILSDAGIASPLGLRDLPALPFATRFVKLAPGTPETRF